MFIFIVFIKKFDAVGGTGKGTKISQVAKFHKPGFSQWLRTVAAVRRSSSQCTVYIYIYKLLLLLLFQIICKKIKSHGCEFSQLTAPSFCFAHNFLIRTPF